MYGEDKERTMLKHIISILKWFEIYGFKGIVSLVLPVYWSQDTEFVDRFVNDGYDVITFKQNGRSYFKGTYFQRMKKLELI